MSKRSLWEILVPTIRTDGRPYKTRYHRVWDCKVREISGGLTILEPAKGQWVNPEGAVFKERMIPVRILATRSEMDKIVDMTIEYYNQEAILAYKISDEYILKYKNNRRVLSVEELDQKTIDEIKKIEMLKKIERRE